MKLPPLLLGAALLFWGWQTGMSTMGGILAVLIEGTRLLRSRWDLTDDEFNRVWNFCSLVFIAAAVYAFTANQGPSAVSRMLDDPSLASQRLAGETSQKTAASLIQWLPIIFSPFIIALAMSRQRTVKLIVFSLIARRRKKLRDTLGLADAEVHADWIYFATTLLSSSINSNEDNWFFVGLSGLVVWALWTRRTRRWAIPVWLLTAGITCLIAFWGQQQLTDFRRFLENYAPQWTWRGSGRRTNPMLNKTDIGQIGEIKQSGNVVIWLELKENTPTPALLRTASYRTYNSSAWTSGRFRVDGNPRPQRDRPGAPGELEDRQRPEPQGEGGGRRAQFGMVSSDSRTGAWVFRKANDPMRINIGMLVDEAPDPGDPLPLPMGFTRFEEMPNVTLKTNDLGVVAVQGVNVLLFDVLYGPSGSIDSDPGSLDSSVPDNERAAIQKLIAEMSLGGKSTNQMLRSISAFFQEKFKYTLWQRTRLGRGTNSALTDFLAPTNRAGHCEYFATATVLLLRELGIPARYAVGWSVQEMKGTTGVIRERHAHAWCLYYLNGQWHDFDTTPASWVAEENRQASMFQFLRDGWSRLKFEFFKWRAGQSTLRDYIWWIVGPMLLFLLYRLIRRKGSRRARAKAEAEARAIERLGLDSEFYLVEKKLAEFGFVRPPGETLGQFLERAVRDGRVGALRETLQAMLRTHYRLRFDPLGLKPEDRDALKHLVRETLDRLGTAKRA